MNFYFFELLTQLKMFEMEDSEHFEEDVLDDTLIGKVDTNEATNRITDSNF